MKIKVFDAKNPVYSDSLGTSINLMVNFSHLKEEFVPFTARESDVQSYGGQLFREALSGSYGKIQEAAPEEEASELDKWKSQMTSSDNTFISRDLENIIDALDDETKARIDSFTIDKYTSKKELRQRNPLKIQPK